MRALLQRVRSARVEIGPEVGVEMRPESGAARGVEIVGAIDQGLLIFLAVYPNDGEPQVRWLIDKLLGLRVFADGDGKMNLSVQDVLGGVLLVSQFTLAGDARRGRRPGFSAAAAPAHAERLYDHFLTELRRLHPKTAAGRFGADMQVHLVNDGPVTLLIDTPEQ